VHGGKKKREPFDTPLIPIDFACIYGETTDDFFRVW
jgi:hypothetical protein